ncbi:hypothetical protein [Ectothiorhodospira haloalkaliphila]|uniref:hypothetical protein n=1 Tax=Ectothiorhodospira haloalkaliphila TaxID=421628 RepID=UPI0004B04078|nr:hypothetical protein [Ectothiorhodospira haloalkaliphila]
MSSHFTVIYDACVLYPAPLRDLLMRLALTDLYRARWTERIHDESPIAEEPAQDG